MKKIVAFILTGIFILTILVVGVIGALKIIYPEMHKESVSAFAEEYSLSQSLVFAVIKAESDFVSDAVSEAGAIGLMQIMPATGKWVAEKLGKTDFETSDLFDESTNIEIGCYYLSYLSKKFDSIDAVLCAYNLGETKTLSLLDDDPNFDFSKLEIKETNNFIKKVKRNMNYYKHATNN